MSIDQIISTIPTPPTTADSENFDSRADPFVASFPQLQTELNQYALEANQTADEITSQYNVVNSKTIEASNSATSASESAQQATSMKEAIEAYVIPTSATYTYTEIDAQFESILPNNGTCLVSKKEDAFTYYSSGASNYYKVTINPRFVRLGDFLIKTSTQDVLLSSHTPDVIEIVAEASGVTTQTIPNGKFVIIQKTTSSDHTLTTFRNNTGSDILTGTTINATNFQDRTNEGVFNQVLILDRLTVSSRAYDVTSVIVFNNITQSDLLNLDTFMAKAGYTKVTGKGDYLYTNDGGTTLVSPIEIRTISNLGVFNEEVNLKGSYKYTGQDISLTSVSTVADCFTPANIDNTVIKQPQAKDPRFMYAEDGLDVRCWAKVLNKQEKRLIAENKKKWGIEEVVFTEQALQTTTGTVATLEVKDGTKYKQGSILSIWNSTTEYRREVVSISANTLTLDSTISKTGIDFIIGGGTQPILSSERSLDIELLGNPTYYSQILKDRLASYIDVFLQINLVDDTGASNLPTGTTGSDGKATFKLNKKITTNHQILKSTDSGVTWSVVTPTIDYNANTITFVTPNIPLSTDILVVSSTSSNDPYIQCNQFKLVEAEPKIVASNSANINKGAKESNQISGKIATGTSSNGYESKVLENINVNGVDDTFEVGKVTNVLTGQLLLVMTTNNNEDGYIYKLLGSDLIGYTPNGTEPSFESQSSWELVSNITTSPEHTAVALNSDTSSGAKWFIVDSKDAEDNSLEVMYGEELISNLGAYDGDSGSFTQLSNGTKSDANLNTVRTFAGAIPLYGKGE